MGVYEIKVGIIGGSGFEDWASDIVMNRREISSEDLRSDFGIPSGNIYVGTICGVEVALLSRHGMGHEINPSNINYRANVEALKSIGCTHIVASTACGSLCETIGRGQLVIPDSFLDRTHSRNGTLFDGTSSKYRGVCHVPMEPGFNSKMINIMVLAAKRLELNVKNGGTIVTIEGPRFSSRAESKALRLLGGDLVNMTTCPEVCIAKEAGILYAAIAMATDYDCWRESEENVCAADVMAVMKKNIVKMTDLILKAVEMIGEEDWDEDINELKRVVTTSNVSKLNV